ncbi:antibiotic biosynthesis monooxygenase family protein [Haploplasma axanthum]|uniref:Heme-degrading monooxygenase isdG n=1 Tax=Haploplasma axanthum TaxID=29552 RepID=A0A449BEY4_HAPAX|nr:antibiotic biosynthesis monooxygenase [Haploplasma axanthum]VEU81014.1 Heme-degrading monooxygenase isdG [Haploplasma axanthum]
MFVIVRTMKVEKGYIDSFKERFSKTSPLLKSPGFIKRELLVSTKDKDFDIIQMMIYFKDKKAFYVWEGSPEHIALHRNKDDEHNKKPEGIIEAKRETFEVIATQEHE